MTGSYSGRFSLKSICLLLCMLIGFSYAFVFYDSQDVQAAGANVEFKIYDDWGDGCNFNIKLNKFDEGAKVTLKLSAPHEIAEYNIWAPNGVSAEKKSDQVLYISFTYHGKNVQGQVTGTDITNGSFKASIVSYSAPKPTNTKAPAKPTNTNTPKPTNTNTPKPTNTNTPKPTNTKAPQPTATNKPQPTATKKPNPTATQKPQPTATKKPNPTATQKPKPTATKKPNPTATQKPEPTNTQTPTNTNTQAPKPTNTKAPKPTATKKPKPTNTKAPTNTQAAEPTVSVTTLVTEAPKPTDTIAPDNTNSNASDPNNNGAGAGAGAAAGIIGQTTTVNNETGATTTSNGGTENGGTGEGTPTPTGSPTPSPVVAALATTGKKKGPVKANWLWLILLILGAGAGFARYKYLKDKKELEGVDLAIAFIPGVTVIADKFGYLGPVKAMPVASDSQEKDHKAFNTATAMKEIKAMEAGEISPFKPAPGTEAKPIQHKGPMKLPSDRSVESPKATEDTKYGGTFKAANKAPERPALKSNAFNKSAGANAQTKTALGGVAATTAATRTMNSRTQTPFKPTNASGIQPTVNSVAQNNAMKNAFRTDNRIETKDASHNPAVKNAFKPVSEAAPEASAETAKPVSSAFKPASTTAAKHTGASSDAARRPLRPQRQASPGRASRHL